VVSEGILYDANGNIIKLFDMNLSFDIENRLIEIDRHAHGTEQYAYNPNNLRIWKKLATGEEEIYFYGKGGRRLASYKLTTNAKGNCDVSPIDYDMYFAGKLLQSNNQPVVLDRLGSIHAWIDSPSHIQRAKYYPFGEERTVTKHDRRKYGSYIRDDFSELDYAEQWYYSSALERFISPDPYYGSIQIGAPDTWNRYAYVNNDPINFSDPHGLSGSGGIFGTLGNFFGSIWNGFISFLGNVGSFFDSLWNGFWNILTGMENFFSSLGGGLYDFIFGIESWFYYWLRPWHWLGFNNPAQTGACIESMLEAMFNGIEIEMGPPSNHPIGGHYNFPTLIKVPYGSNASTLKSTFAEACTSRIDIGNGTRLGEGFGISVHLKEIAPGCDSNGNIDLNTISNWDDSGTYYYKTAVAHLDLVHPQLEGFGIYGHILIDGLIGWTIQTIFYLFGGNIDPACPAIPAGGLNP
jgi:RHS repeat-associated protein